MICTFCDPNGGFDKGKHKREHTLLSVRRIHEEESTEDDDNKVLNTVKALEQRVDGKLSELEATLNTLDDRIGVLDERFTERMGSMDDRIEARFRAMDDRFSRIEDLLEKLLLSKASVS